MDILLLLVLAAFGLAIDAQAAPVADPRLASVYIVVSVEGLDPDTRQTVRRRLTTGTGVLVNGTGHVLTAKHVIQQEVGPNDTLVYEGYIGTNRAPASTLWPLDRRGAASNADIALLQFPVGMMPDFPHLCVVMGATPAEAAKGIGFPDGLDFVTRPGTVSAPEDVRGEILVNMGLSPGMSGGAILTSENAVMGIITGGRPDLNSYDFYSPIDRANSLLTDFAVGRAAEGCRGGSPSPESGPTNPAPEPVIHRFRVDETNDRHESLTGTTTKSFAVTHRAPADYVITDAQLERESATRVSNLRITVAPDGKSVTVSFDLTSGPQIDRYRGWLHGTLVVTMEQES